MKRLLTILSFLIAVKGVAQSHTVNETYSNGQFGKKLTINSVVAKSPIEITTGGGTDTIGCSTCGSGGGSSISAAANYVGVGRSSTSLTYSKLYFDTTKFWLGNIGNLSTVPTAIIDIYPTFPGTVSVTNASATVTGTNTRFLSNFKPADTIYLNGAQARIVSSITSNTSLTLTANYTGSTNATAAYTNQMMERGVFALHENGNIYQAGAAYITWNNYSQGLGYKALNAQTSGQANTAVGNGALQLNTTGGSNTGIGYRALAANTTNSNSTAVGMSALTVSTGQQNTATGAFSLTANTSGQFNAAFGSSSLQANQTGSSNAAFGNGSLQANTASNNAAFGFETLKANTSGTRNVAVGYQALLNATTAHDNTAVGSQALAASSNTGTQNTGIGSQSLLGNTSGSINTALGYLSLPSNTTGASNTAIGVSALGSNTTGSSNIGVGVNAGKYITGGSTALLTPSQSIYIGGETRALADNPTNEIVIGYGMTGNGSNTTTIGNSSTTDTYFGGTTKMHITLGTPPANATATGTAGTFIFGTDGYLYLCTATNTWVRIQLSTW